MSISVKETMPARILPYHVKTLAHVSASGLKDYSHCEAMSAYRRNYEGVPEVLQPPNMIYGIVFHNMVQKLGNVLWKKARVNGGVIPPDYCQNFHLYAKNYLNKVLNGIHGPRDAEEPPVRFRWFSRKKMEKMSAMEYNRAVQEEKNKMYGRMYNAIEAYRLDFTIPSGCIDVEFEYNFSSQNIMLRPILSDFPPVKIDGAMDRIQIYPNQEYDVTDYKTGSIIQHYRSRHNLVEDIQMTCYDFVGRLIYGKMPKAIYIQPMDIPTEFRKEHGAHAMRMLRISVPRRNEDQFNDLGYFAADVVRMVEMVVNSEGYTQSEREDWVPQSLYARKAEIQQNVLQGRFIPRIGPWCDSCLYLGLCQRDHQDDWKKYSTADVDIPEAIPESEMPPPKEKNPDANYTLFDIQPKRSKYIKKSERAIKDELLATKDFMQPKSSIGRKGFYTFIKNVFEWMRGKGPCQCTRSKLEPLWLMDHLRALYKGEISLQEALDKCPLQDCERKSTTTQKSDIH